MPDPLTNLEIQDVLSSIRRLVSEDSRNKPSEKPVAGPKGGAEAGKLVLTEALRVPETDTESETLRENIAGGGMFEEGTPVPELGADDLPDIEASRGGDVDQDAASLEDTIAELEAAVAGIGGEFEPDGSEVDKRAKAADAELDEAFEDGFEVDIGDPVTAELSRPVTSGTMEPAESAAETTVSAVDDEVTAKDQADDDIEAVDEDATPAFSRDTDAAVSVDEPLVTAAPAEPVRMQRLHLTAADAVYPDDDAPWDRPGREETPLSLTEAVPESGEADDANMRADDADEMSFVDVDMETLRSIVAEIIRHELQGPLGERITRNVRMLVRREIDRALNGDDPE